jgi:hypothetical protein
MTVVGCEVQTRYREIAILDTTTGEAVHSELFLDILFHQTFNRESTGLIVRGC